ncbi:phage baseplate upper protein [Lactiplantibacillus plantarum]|uniref:phage baseplate upper protein n=1 Tax=Lactiplantibacillus plantarum TaxID=1590 RepID=UPI000B410727|nr:phage baseplate upper protein [Lactiplantibacillus plantarum]
MQSLTYVIGKDKRNLVDDIKNFKIDFEDSNLNWVQARQYEDGMRQVFVTIKNEDSTPFDLTGCNYWFEGILPDGVHKILDANHGVAIDPVNGQFRFDMPKQAFAVAGSYVQAFFRIMKDGANVTTLEFDLQVLADKVISGLVPSDYVTPFEDLYNQLNKMGTDTKTMLQTIQKQISDLEAKITQDGLFTQAEADAFKQQLLTVINGIKAKWHDIEVTDYEPTRDGNVHMLSESYSSIDEAKKDYPAATSLADTKDWCAITEAITEGQKQGRSIYLAPGNYFVNKTVTLPTGVTFYGSYQNSRIFASSQMGEDSKKAPLAILEYDDAGQPPIYIENIQVLGTNDQKNQLIGLHLGGNRASKISNFVVSYCFGHGTLVYPTHSQSDDVENTTFEHYWQVQSGSFCIKSNASINRGNITDFAVYDSQITTLDVRDENQSNTSSPAVEIINEDNKDAVKSVYGIEFTRCFLHAQGNNLVRVVGCHFPSATHSINFDFIKGELHDVHGDLGSGSDKFFLFHLENCWHVMVDHSSQLAYSGASYVEIVRCAFCDIQTAGIANLEWQHSDSMIFTLDKYSYENHINLIGMDIYLAPGTADTMNNPDYGKGFGQANDAIDLFSKMKDDGSDNHITGWQIGQTLTLNNEPQRLHQITNGKIDGLDDSWQKGVTSSSLPTSVHTKHVLASGTTDIRLLLPTKYKRVSGFLMSFRAIGADEDLNKLQLVAGSQLVQMPTDQNWHVWTGICQTNILQSIGLQTSNNEILSNEVTIEIEYMDCFMENKIPFYPDFVALPAPTVGEANY